MNPNEPLPGSPPPPTAGAPANLGVRILYMLFFAVVFWLACWVLAASALLQLVLTVLGGRPNADLARFGVALARYCRQVIEFLLFATDIMPFPFSEWSAP